MATLSLADQLKRKKPIGQAQGSGHGQELQRSIGTFQLTMFGVGATVGTGIFFVLQEAVPEAGPATVVAFLIAGVAAGLSALCYAELASAIPVSGSTYSYAYHALGELMAVVIAACVLLEYGVAAGAVAVGWSGYFNNLMENLFGFRLPDALSYSPIPVEGATSGIVNLPAVVLVLLCMLLLIRGASESAKINTIMVLIKLGVLVFFSLIAFTAFEADRFSNFWAAGSSGVAAAAATIFFSFIGLDAISTAGEEVKNPQRALPLALLGALVTVVGVYLTVAIAGIGSQPLSEFSSPEQADAGLSVILKNITGQSWPSIILAAGAVISVFSVTLVTLYGQTRIMFAISRDGLVSPKFSEVDPRTQTPKYSTIVVSIAVALIGGFIPADYLWDTVSIGTLAAFTVVAVGVIVLRRTRPDLERPFRVPLFPFVPILTVVTCVYILAGLHWTTWVTFGIWLAIVLAFYFSYGRHNARLNFAEAIDMRDAGAGAPLDLDDGDSR